jgi:hypothetical protein
MGMLFLRFSESYNLEDKPLCSTTENASKWARFLFITRNSGQNNPAEPLKSSYFVLSVIFWRDINHNLLKRLDKCLKF